MSDRTRSRRALAIDELAALNMELLAMAKAGIAFDAGLRRAAPGYQTGLRKAFESIAMEISSGVPLETALAKSKRRVPPFYATLVKVGIRTGQLSETLQAMSVTLDKFADLRRHWWLSVLYPLLIALLSTVLFWLGISYVAPIFVSLLSDSDSITLPVWAEPLKNLGYLRMFIVLGIALWTSGFLAIWWFTGRSSTHSEKLGTDWKSGRRLGRWTALIRAATFSEVLGLLMRHHVPLAEALTLAAEATEDRALIARVEEVARQLNRGTVPSETLLRTLPLPPLVPWLMTRAAAEHAADALHRAGERYRHQARDEETWIRFAGPLTALIFLGAIPSLVFTSAMVVPWTWLLHRLSVEVF